MHGDGLIGILFIIGVFVLRKVLKVFADSADAKVKEQRARRGEGGGVPPRPGAEATRPSLPRFGQQGAEATRPSLLRPAWSVPNLEEERQARAARLAAKRAQYEQAAKAAAERQKREQEAEVAALTGAGIIPPELTPAPDSATTAAAVEDSAPLTPVAPPPSATAAALVREPVLNVPTGPDPISPWLAALRDPASARKAILLKEILGTPVALR